MCKLCGTIPITQRKNEYRLSDLKTYELGYVSGCIGICVICNQEYPCENMK